MTETCLYLGVDGGGTKCVARLFSGDGRELGVGYGGPANAYQSLERAQQSMIESAFAALDSARLSQDTISQLKVGAGLAGVNVSSVLQAVQAWAHPFNDFHITTDVHIACVGAHQKNTGAIVIVGTGTCGYARIAANKNQVEEFFIGGHGFPIGDQAGGAWMGFEAVRAVLLAQDEMIPRTLLTKKIFDQWQTSPDRLLDKIALANSSDYAKLATCVFEAAESGDASASLILSEAVNYLSELIKKLNAKNPGPIALIGGLSKKMESFLPSDIRTLLSEAKTSPEVGAFYWRRDLDN